METEILDLWAESGKTVLFITHDLEEAIALSDQVVVLSAGPASRIVATHNVDLPRPRNLLDLKTDPRLTELYGLIWSDLRQEVLKSYERNQDEARIPMVVLQVMFGAAMLLAWQGLVTAGIMDKFFFSRPSDIGLRVWQWISTGTVWAHLAVTIIEAALSFAIGVAAGITFGFLLARVNWLAELLDPYIRIANALPRVVLAPIFLLWFGLGIWSKVALGVIVVFFIVFSYVPGCARGRSRVAE